MDLQQKYIRNTHTNGVYRKDMDEVWNKLPDTFSCVVHLLDPKTPMDICEIMAQGYSYGACFPLENNGDVETNPGILSAVLELLVNFDMIKKVQKD